MPRGKRDPVLLSPELPGPGAEGLRGAGDGRRSAEEEEEDGHLPGVPRDDLTKSMSSSSVSSYHSALCSDGTETFKDCLEFLDEEGSPGRAAPGRWAPAGAPGVPPPPGPLARPQRAQLSSAAKNSPAPGHGGRMGPLGGDRQPVPAAAAAGEPPVPRQPGAMRGGAPSDSDEVDGEVQALTARAFRSLSGLPGARLDMCSSHTSSSLSNSLSEDGGRPRRWPVGAGEPRGAATALHGRVGWPFPASLDGELLGKEQFECVDVELESGEARKGHGKKRTVPKRQILLKRKERKETGFGPAPQPPARKEPPSKGRAIGEDFRLNYQQFMKAASLGGTDRTRAASCLVKNVLAKKMQYEQRIKMEQKGLRGSSTSSGPSSAGTDLLGDGLEGKSSSLSRSDCSFSAEDLLGGGMPVATAAAGSTTTTTTTHPTKGVVLSEATRETVCNLRKTFNELNQRMKYQEVLEGRWLPAAAEEHTSERICYHRARALFEAQPGVGKVLDVAPRFARAPRPWPSLKERAIGPIHSQTLPFKAESRALPAAPPRRPFASSRAQEARPLPQSRPEKPPAVPRRPASPDILVPRGSPPAPPPKPEEKGKGRVPQPRDVRKLVKSSYSLKFGTAGTSRGTVAPASSGEPPPATPLVIHCTSVRREPAPEPAGEEVLAAPGRDPAPCAEGSAKPPGSRGAPSHSSPINITRVQATRRGAAPAEEPPASPPRRERSELRVPPRAPVAEGVPHVETHLHVLVGRSGESSPAPGSALLRAEKTVLLPPPPPSPAEVKELRGHGSTRVLQAAEGPEPLGQRHSSGDGRDPLAGAPGGSSACPRPAEPAGKGAAEPQGNEQRQQQPGSRRVSVGSGGSVGGTGPTAPPRAGEGSEGLLGRLPERREAWEHSPQWLEPYPPAAPAENSNYLAMPERAPKSTLMPKLPSVPNPGSASFGASMVTNVSSLSFGPPAPSSLANTSFGAPLVSNPNKSFGAPQVPSLCSTSLGNPLVPNPSSASFGNPLVPRASFGCPLVPNASSASFGSPLATNVSGAPFGNPLVPSLSFGNPLVPNTSSASFGASLIPNVSSASFGNPLTPNPSSASIGNPLIPNTSNVSFGSPLVPDASSASFGSPFFPNPSSASFGNLLVPSASFGNPLIPNPSSTSFGNPLVPNPSNASFGSPLVPNPSSASFGNPLIPHPGSSSFGSPLVTNPVPTSLGYPSASNVAGSFFGSPFVPNTASAPLGAGAYPLPAGDVPWSKPSPELPLPRPPEGPAAEPPAQPQPEDAPHFLRMPDGPPPSGRSRQSPPKPFPASLPAQRRMLVDPSSGKCYYMEPPRQPQMKTLYDPETGQYLEVLVPPVASHTGLYKAPFNPLVVAPGVYGPPYAPFGGFPRLPAPPPSAPSAPSPPHPELPPADNPGTPGSAPKGEGPSPAGGPDCGYLESLYYIPTGMRVSPGPEQLPGRASPAAPEGSLLRM